MSEEQAIVEEIKQFKNEPEAPKDKDFYKEMAEAQTTPSFGIKDAVKRIVKKDKTTVSMSGDVLFKDIQMFIPELIGNILLMLAGIVGIFLARFFSQGYLNEFHKTVTQVTFDAVSEHILFLHNILAIGIAVPIAYMMLLFIFKWFLFYPRGKKQIVIRAWKMGVARIGVETISENYVKFEKKKELSDEMHINYSHKAIDYYTGRPMLLLEEGQAENTPLHRNIKTNEKVKDKGNVNASIFSAALKYCDYQNKKAQGFLHNPTNLLLLVAIAIIVVIAFFVITKGSPTTAIQGVAAGMTARGG